MTAPPLPGVAALTAAVLLTPQAVLASDFGPLMLLMLIPFALLALLIWVMTWPTTAGLSQLWLKWSIRVVGLCLIFTPTHTPGGNGQAFSVALYDFVISGFGADSVYAKQAMINVAIASVLIAPFVVTGAYIRRKHELGS